MLNLRVKGVASVTPICFEMKESDGDVDIYASTADGSSALVAFFCAEDGKLHLCTGLNQYQFLKTLSINSQGEITTV